jgi:antitoxin MazE
MKAEITRIGNSRGIRIPKPLIEQCALGDTVELSVEENRLVISGKRRPRHGWDEAFRAAHAKANDELLLESVPPSKFDQDEWRW